jgi:putative oxidoreductase
MGSTFPDATTSREDLMSIGTMLVRGVVGPLFMGHGAQKLWGRFGGHGLEGTGGFFESLGLRPGRRHAQAAGVAEFTGGALLTLGALTPVATTIISSTMFTAIRKVHLKSGPWATEGGWEYNAVLIATATLLAEIGPGSPSVDDALFPNLHGKGWAVGSLLAAAAGSALVTSPQLTGAAAAAQDVPVSDEDSRFVRDAAEGGVDSGSTSTTA